MTNTSVCDCRRAAFQGQHDPGHIPNFQSGGPEVVECKGGGEGCAVLDHLCDHSLRRCHWPLLTPAAGLAQEAMPPGPVHPAL